MQCPRCSVVFEKEVAKNVEGFRPQSKRKGKRANKKPKSSFDKRGVPYKDTPPNGHQKKDQVKTFNTPSNSLVEKWVFSDGKKSNYIFPPAKWVKRTTGTNNQNGATDAKMFGYNNNYKGKNPVTKTQW